MKDEKATEEAQEAEANAQSTDWQRNMWMEQLWTVPVEVRLVWKT